MATVQVTERSFEEMPAKTIDELVGKVKALDMDEIRRKIDAVEPQEPRVAKGGGV